MRMSEDSNNNIWEVNQGRRKEGGYMRTYNGSQLLIVHVTKGIKIGFLIGAKNARMCATFLEAQYTHTNTWC